MGNLLFSPSGRTNPSDFVRGAIILSVLLFLIKAANLVSIVFGGIMGMVGLVLIYCWVALYIKRFHDAGKTGWFSILPVLFMIGFGLVLVEPIVQRMIAPELVTALEEATLAAAEEGDFAGIVAVAQEYAAPLAEKTALHVAFARGIWAFLVAYLVNMRLKRDDNENQFGPAS